MNGTFDVRDRGMRTKEMAKKNIGARGEQPDLLVRGLGWFSVGLGVAGIAAPREVARLIGVRPEKASRMTLRSARPRHPVRL